MNIDAAIAKFVVGTRYEHLSEEVLKAAKHHILHTIATVIAGSSAPGIKEVLAMVEESAGAKESTVMVYGSKMSAIDATLVNSTMAHARDYCMNDDRTYYKSSVTAVPASFAVAEKVPAVTGKDLLTGVCVGIELGVRIALATNPKPPHARSAMIGGFAAAMTTAWLLGLDEEQVLDALGIAYCQVCTSGGSTFSPALNKRLLAGLAARAGVFSALLAQKGFKSSRNVLHGPKGYYVTYQGVEGDVGTLITGLGKDWEFIHVGPKGYPCCRVLHAPIDATLALVKEHDVKSDEVESVSVRGSRRNYFHSSEAITVETIEKRRHPQGVVDAQFSVPWAVATAIEKRAVFIEDFTEQGIANPNIHKISGKVHVLAERALEDTDTMCTPVVVEIHTKNRGVLSQRIDFPKGNPLYPVSLEETRQNFRKCAAYAAKPLAKSNIDEAIATIDNLEAVDNIRGLIKLLSG